MKDGSLVTVERPSCKPCPVTLSVLSVMWCCIDPRRRNCICAVPSPSPRGQRAGSGTQYRLLSWQEFIVWLLVMEFGETLYFSSAQVDALWWPCVQTFHAGRKHEKKMTFTLQMKRIWKPIGAVILCRCPFIKLVSSLESLISCLCVHWTSFNVFLCVNDSCHTELVRHRGMVRIDKEQWKGRES